MHNPLNIAVDCIRRARPVDSMQTSGALIIIKQRLGLPIVSFQSDLNLFRRVIHALNQPRVGMSVTAILQFWRFEIDIVNLSADRTTETAGYPLFQNPERSEERRVGKECRS